MRGSLPSVLVAGALALLLAPSCRQIVGIGDQPPGGTGGSGDASAEASTKCGGFPWTPGACEACMQDNCCTQATECRQKDLCATEFDCIAQCAGSDDACRARCISPPKNDDTMAALASCQAESCAGPCALQCGGYEAYFGPPLPSPADAGSLAACFTCLESPTYCAALRKIASCTSCLDLEFCEARCPGFYDDICIQNCGAEYPIEGTGADSGLLDVLGECSGECPSGTDWSCVGQVAWPKPTAPHVTFRLQVLWFNHNTAIDGAQVRVCPLMADVNCDNALPQTFATDPTGVATLTLTPPFNGYFEISQPNFVPELLVITPSIAETMDAGTLKGTAMFDSGLLTTFVSQVANSPNTTTQGVLFIGPVDCSGQPAPNVSFAADQTTLGASAESYYFVGGTTPDGKATATSNAPSGGLVGGGWVQVDPGPILVTATVDGARVAEQVMPVRAGALTEVQLVPTP